MALVKTAEVPTDFDPEEHGASHVDGANSDSEGADGDEVEGREHYAEVGYVRISLECVG